MSHKPPVPPAAQAPYPPHAAPLPEGSGGITGRDIAVGAAVGIGSAAITAALLFTGGRRKS